MGNAAYTEQYKQRCDECRSLFIADHFTQEEAYCLTDGYAVHVRSYAGNVGNYNLSGSECTLLDVDEKTIAEWRSIDDSAAFYAVIKHSNQRTYLIFRQDLYGFSVLDLGNGKRMQFFPELSLNGGETFIWTDVAYNPESDVLAVTGCYWACPDSTQLFKFDDPMSDSPEYVDLVACFDGDYDLYDDVCFVQWAGGDLHVTRYVIETKQHEPVVVKQEEYLSWLAQRGQAL